MQPSGLSPGSLKAHQFQTSAAAMAPTAASSLPPAATGHVPMMSLASGPMHDRLQSHYSASTSFSPSLPNHAGMPLANGAMAAAAAAVAAASPFPSAQRPMAAWPAVQQAVPPPQPPSLRPGLPGLPPPPPEPPQMQWQLRKELLLSLPPDVPHPSILLPPPACRRLAEDTIASFCRRLERTKVSLALEEHQFRCTERDLQEATAVLRRAEQLPKLQAAVWSYLDENDVICGPYSLLQLTALLKGAPQTQVESAETGESLPFVDAIAATPLRSCVLERNTLRERLAGMEAGVCRLLLEGRAIALEVQAAEFAALAESLATARWAPAGGGPPADGGLTPSAVRAALIRGALAPDAPLAPSALATLPVAAAASGGVLRPATEVVAEWEGALHEAEERRGAAAQAAAGGAWRLLQRIQPPPNDEKAWLYVSGGRSAGPFSFLELSAWLAAGQIDSYALVAAQQPLGLKAAQGAAAGEGDATPRWLLLTEVSWLYSRNPSAASAPSLPAAPPMSAPPDPMFALGGVQRLQQQRPPTVPPPQPPPLPQPPAPAAMATAAANGMLPPGMAPPLAANPLLGAPSLLPGMSLPVPLPVPLPAMLPNGSLPMSGGSGSGWGADGATRTGGLQSTGSAGNLAGRTQQSQQQQQAQRPRPPPRQPPPRSASPPPPQQAPQPQQQQPRERERQSSATLQPPPLRQPLQRLPQPSQGRLAIRLGPQSQAQPLPPPPPRPPPQQQLPPPPPLPPQQHQQPGRASSPQPLAPAAQEQRAASVSRQDSKSRSESAASEVVPAKRTSEAEGVSSAVPGSTPAAPPGRAASSERELALPAPAPPTPAPARALPPAPAAAQTVRARSASPAEPPHAAPAAAPLPPPPPRSASPSPAPQLLPPPLQPPDPAPQPPAVNPAVLAQSLRMAKLQFLTSLRPHLTRLLAGMVEDVYCDMRLRLLERGAEAEAQQGEQAGDQAPPEAGPEAAPEAQPADQGKREGQAEAQQTAQGAQREARGADAAEPAAADIAPAPAAEDNVGGCAAAADAALKDEPREGQVEPQVQREEAAERTQREQGEPGRSEAAVPSAVKEEPKEEQGGPVQQDQPPPPPQDQGTPSTKPEPSGAADFDADLSPAAAPSSTAPTVSKAASAASPRRPRRGVQPARLEVPPAPTTDPDAAAASPSPAASAPAAGPSAAAAATSAPAVDTSPPGASGDAGAGGGERAATLSIVHDLLDEMLMLALFTVEAQALPVVPRSTRSRRQGAAATTPAGPPSAKSGRREAAVASPEEVGAPPAKRQRQTPKAASTKADGGDKRSGGAEEARPGRPSEGGESSPAAAPAPASAPGGSKRKAKSRDRDRDRDRDRSGRRRPSLSGSEGGKPAAADAAAVKPEAAVDSGAEAAAAQEDEVDAAEAKPVSEPEARRNRQRQRPAKRARLEVRLEHGSGGGEGGQGAREQPEAVAAELKLEEPDGGSGGSRDRPHNTQQPPPRSPRAHDQQHQRQDEGEEGQDEDPQSRPAKHRRLGSGGVSTEAEGGEAKPTAGEGGGGTQEAATEPGHKGAGAGAATGDGQDATAPAAVVEGGAAEPSPRPLRPPRHRGISAKELKALADGPGAGLAAAFAAHAGPADETGRLLEATAGRRTRAALAAAAVNAVAASVAEALASMGAGAAAAAAAAAPAANGNSAGPVSVPASKGHQRDRSRASSRAAAAAVPSGPHSPSRGSSEANAAGGDEDAEQGALHSPFRPGGSRRAASHAALRSHRSLDNLAAEAEMASWHAAAAAGRTSRRGSDCGRRPPSRTSSSTQEHLAEGWHSAIFPGEPYGKAVRHDSLTMLLEASLMAFAEVAQQSEAGPTAAALTGVAGAEPAGAMASAEGGPSVAGEEVGGGEPGAWVPSIPKHARGRRSARTTVRRGSATLLAAVLDMQHHDSHQPQVQQQHEPALVQPQPSPEHPALLLGARRRRQPVSGSAEAATAAAAGLAVAGSAGEEEAASLAHPHPGRFLLEPTHVAGGPRTRRRAGAATPPLPPLDLGPSPPLDTRSGSAARRQGRTSPLPPSAEDVALLLAAGGAGRHRAPTPTAASACESGPADSQQQLSAAGLRRQQERLRAEALEQLAGQAGCTRGLPLQALQALTPSRNYPTLPSGGAGGTRRAGRRRALPNAGQAEPLAHVTPPPPPPHAHPRARAAASEHRFLTSSAAGGGGAGAGGLATAEQQQEMELAKWRLLAARAKKLKFGRSRIAGWGLFAVEPIEANEFVTEYCGALIRKPLDDVRQRQYDAAGLADYMFAVDDTWVVDATLAGNAARFINHCCDPNCVSRIEEVGGERKIAIYTLRRIEAGEELHYDYKLSAVPGAERIPCGCGARNCKGFMN